MCEISCVSEKGRQLVQNIYLFIELLSNPSHGASADAGNSIGGSREFGDTAGYGG